MGRPEVDERDNRGVNISKNLARRSFNLGHLAIVELPRLEIPEMKQAVKLWQELEEGEPYSMTILSTQEKLLGDKLCGYTQRKLMDEVIEKYPKLSRPIMDLYFELFLKERTRQWNFSGGVVAIESKQLLDSEIQGRSGMRLDDIDQLILRNKENILDELRDTNPNFKGLSLNTIGIGLPTVAELVALSQLGLDNITLNRPVWTSTKVFMGITNERVNLTCNLQADPGQEIGYVKPGSRSDNNTWFFPIIRLTRGI